MRRRDTTLWIAGAAALLAPALLLLWDAGRTRAPPGSRRRSEQPPPAASETGQTKATERRAVSPARPSREAARARGAERTLRVSVRFAGGQPARATVHALTRNPDALVSRRAPNGLCELELAGEHATIWCRVDGYAQLVRECPLTDMSIESIDFRLPPRRRVAIRVVGPDGVPIVTHPEFLALGPSVTALHAVATRDWPPAILPLCTERVHEAYGAGRFVSLFSIGAVTVPAGSIGVLLLDEGERFFVSLVYGHDVIATQEWPSSEEVVFRLAPEQLRRGATRLQVRLSDPSLPAALVQGRGRLDLGEIRGDWRDIDDSGAISIESAGSGIYRLTVEARGYATLQQLVNVTAGRPAHLETLELRPPMGFAGRVESDDDRSVEGTVYRVDPAAQDAPWLLERGGFSVGSDGTFDLRDVPAGRTHLVLVTRVGLRAAETIDTSGRVEGPVFDLPPSRIVVLEGPGEDASSGLYTLVDSEERPLWSGKVGGRDLVPLRLVPGRYSIHWREHALSPALLERPVPFEVEDGTEWVRLPGR